MIKQYPGPAPAVAAVHDLSCVGRCALTVVLPALAALGVQPVPLPTAVLSTHTGGYTGMATRDLTDFLPECMNHWRTLDLKLDGIYSGYLASVEQAETVRGLIAWQREVNGALAIVDPVMGDEGQFYSAIPPDMPAHMLKLCGEADLITPNLTEAALMLGLPYPEGAVEPETLRPMLEGFGAKTTMITGVLLADGRHANVCYDRDTGETCLCAFRRIPEHYPGTGDLFTSVIAGLMVQGESAVEAMRFATACLERVIEHTWRLKTEVRAGVQLERALGLLTHREEIGALPPVERL